ncbi:hypothetical protein MVEN_01741200 [Mycena venus]|uniref:Uncharacterized protein n=1 Tax=Mycena venus TaxID=2733690 RepID=A0A8H7CPT9_9AGAR|nr:hypothetical protein MVEN_01741200 [Mycena venus]
MLLIVPSVLAAMIMRKSVPDVVAAVLLLLVLSVSAEPVTLYGLSAVPGPTSLILAESITVSAIGVGGDGWTTYVEEEAITSQVIVAPSTTITAISVPTTLPFTFEENASGERYSLPMTEVGATLYESCGFGADGQGTCVEHQLIQSTEEILFVTTSGSVAPWYTLAASPSAALPTRICVGHSRSIALVMTAVVVAVLHAL